MILKEYEIKVETKTFQSMNEQKKFIKQFVKFVNGCNYSKIPATMIEVTEDKVEVVNNVYTSAKVSVIITIVKPENEDKVLNKVYKIEEKMSNVNLLGVTLVKQI